MCIELYFSKWVNVVVLFVGLLICINLMLFYVNVVFSDKCFMWLKLLMFILIVIVKFLFFENCWKMNVVLGFVMI